MESVTELCQEKCLPILRALISKYQVTHNLQHSLPGNIWTSLFGDAYSSFRNNDAIYDIAYFSI